MSTQKIRIRRASARGWRSCGRRAGPGNSRLQRRLQQIEKLDPGEKCQVLQLINAFIKRGQLKRKAG